VEKREPERAPRITPAEWALLVLVVGAPLVILVVVLLTRSP
jgi:hypothetical protein